MKYTFPDMWSRTKKYIRIRKNTTKYFHYFGLDADKYNMRVERLLKVYLFNCFPKYSCKIYSEIVFILLKKYQTSLHLHSTEKRK